MLKTSQAVADEACEDTLAFQHVSLMEALFAVAVIGMAVLLAVLYHPQARQQYLSHSGSGVHSSQIPSAGSYSK
ncbi:hypothetical protein ELH24_02870 [Rhizobium ruizarguesonis]|uniref:Uncharacterized protein n=1 Tax=Rhizobium ruizarguesonis TaxID=2081791 RepID=A0AAE4YXY1_9HYPH|nr:hypothetical protein [Rhizobium ruizarguesonis]NEI53255.1 hypothetical protein [Rhizobium ruizarguesonis]TBC97736.1 hypothetical protein ELH25_02875 [Rhizobium ruizarguesonis]TBD14576.1 hypothetical protein ELH24_02870 [Rhizobium ruizarguesonis]TBE95631.1 hypothetical protein ELG98_02870 [Rhizobium ruizarguesonis]